MVVQKHHPIKEFSHSLDEYTTALSNFTLAGEDEKQKEQPPKEFTKSADPLVDEFFEYIAVTGRPYLSWDLMRQPFIWKLKATINDMLLHEAEEQADDILKEELINRESLKSAREFVIEKAEHFTGTPFTIQRLCELLTTPNRHYHTTEKFLRALERNINIVTTITENGDRITGAEHFPPDEDSTEVVPVERNFIVSVDELDEPLPCKIAKLSCSSGGSTTAATPATATPIATPNPSKTTTTTAAVLPAAAAASAVSKEQLRQEVEEEEEKGSGGAGAGGSSSEEKESDTKKKKKNNNAAKQKNEMETEMDKSQAQAAEAAAVVASEVDDDNKKKNSKKHKAEEEKAEDGKEPPPVVVSHATHDEASPLSPD